ncbi:MAG: TonB-dependent receptor [Proteobacteria bacterium]|nr:TonB-dependent receptor [Pseudomonadota bacterium]
MNIGNAFACTASALAISAAAVPSCAYAQEAPRQYDIPAQSMGSALRKLGRIAQRPIAFNGAEVKGLKSTAVSGQFSVQEALNRMIGGTALRASITPSGVITVRLAAAQALGSDADENAALNERVPEIVVIGNSTLNADIRHTANEARPYVVLTSKDIEQSQATSINEFLEMKLPQNNSSPAAGRASSASTASAISLRGLGTQNTLLLIDGRPAPRTFTARGIGSQDINGIPMSSIERIEILPASSGGLYGGNAIGGVINVILKRNYSGLTVSAGYQNTFRVNAPIVNLEIAGGHNFNGGKTRVTFSAAIKRGDPILNGEVPWVAQARAIRLANAPEQYYSVSTPPLGSTPNIRSTNGVPLVLKDGRALGSSFTFVPIGYVAGNSLQGFIDNAGKYNLTLPDNALGDRMALRTAPRTWSVALGVRQEITDWLDLYVDGRRDSNEGRSLSTRVPSFVRIGASAPQNPFQQSIFVQFPILGLDSENRQEFVTTKLSFGGIIKISSKWRASLDFGWGQNKNLAISSLTNISNLGRNAIISGLPGSDGQPAINILQDPAATAIDLSSYTFPFDGSRQGPFTGVERNATFRIGGPLPSVLGITPVFAGGVDYKNSILKSVVTSTLRDTNQASPAYTFNYTYYPERSQKAYSAFGNVTLPLIDSGQRSSWGDRAELSGTLRYDRFDDRTYDSAAISTLPSADAPRPSVDYVNVTDRSFGYTLSALYGPTRDIFFRASYATGFTPPAMGDRVPTIQDVAQGDFSVDPYTEDPLRGYTSIGTDAAWRSKTNGNLDLKSETSHTIALGVVLTPRWVEGLRLSLDYVDTTRKGEIISFLTNDDLIADPQIFGDRIRRENRPLTQEEIDLGYTATPIVYLDSSPINLSRSRVRSLDFAGTYTLETESAGKFQLSLMATKQIDFTRQFAPGAPSLNYVNWVGYPSEWRANAGLDWSKDGFSAGLNFQYFDKTRVGNPTDSQATRDLYIKAQGGEYIGAQYYFDFYSSINLGRLSKNSVFQGMKLELGVRNIFDAAPKFYVYQERTAPNGDALGRRFSVNLTKEF